MNEGALLSFNIGGSDPDGDSLSFSAAGLPQGAAFNPSTRSFSWTPDYAQAGLYNVTFTVSDGNLSASETVGITVTNVNRPPVLNAIPPQAVNEGVLLTFSVSGSDPDGDPLTYGAEGLIGGATFNPATRTFSWTPGYTQSGQYNVTFTLSDGNLSVSTAAQITVNNVNRPPTANAGPNRALTLPAGQSSMAVQLNGSGAEPGRRSLHLCMDGAPDPADVQNPTVSLSAGTYTFSLVVTDSAGAASAPSNVTITVNGSSLRPPQITVDPLTCSIAQGANRTITVSANSPDGRTVILSAAPLIENASFQATSGTSATGTFSLVPGYKQEGKYFVTFTAKDAYGLFDSKTAEITVTKNNQSPVITMLSAATVDEGKVLAIPVTVSDPNGDIVTLSASGLPARNAIFVPSTGTTTFAPDYEQAGVYDITVTANDGQGSTSRTVRVTVNDVPTGGAGQPRELVLNVDPVENPSFLTTQRVTGSVNAPSQPQVSRLKSALITSLNPSAAEQGTTLNVTLEGNAADYATHFANGVSKADFGPGITVTALNVTSGNQATAVVAIDPAAGEGPRSVSIVTGGETAVSILAFNVMKGKSRISGRIVDTETGQAIANAIVTIQGTNLSATTDQNGNFTLLDAPSGQQTLLVNAPDHQLIRTSISAQPGAEQNLGEMKTATTVFNPNAPSSVSLGSLLSRIFIDFRDKRTVEDLKQTVIDAVQYVGGRDLGVIDEYGNELNPNVTETPFLRLTPSAVATIAMRAKTDSTTTLGELLWQFTEMFRWNDPQGSSDGKPNLGKPNLARWINSIQQAVNAAWANPSHPSSRLFILLFNSGKTLAPQPPTIVPDLPLNELQASLMRFSIFALGARAIDPEDVFSQLPEDYFPVDEGVVKGALSKPILLAGLMTLSDMPRRMFAPQKRTLPSPIFLAQAPGQQIVAKAARSKENGYIGKSLLLDGTSSLKPSGVPLVFEWSVTQFAPADPNDPNNGSPYEFRQDLNTLVGARHWIIYFYPKAAGEFKVQLLVRSQDNTLVSNPYEITVAVRHWPCDPRGLDPGWDDTEVVNLERPWQNVLCDMGTNNAVDILKTELGNLVGGTPEAPKSAYEEWVAKGTIAGDVTARIKAEQNFMRFFQNDSKISAVIRENAKVYEKYLPQIMEAAKEKPPTVSQQIKGMVVKELVTGSLSYFKDQADKLGESIMYAMLDKVIDGLIEGLRPSPPGITRVEIVDAQYDPSKKIALIYFSRSASDPGPEGKKTICAGGDPGNAQCNADFYYRLIRESSGELTKFGIYPEGSDVVNGVVPTNERPSGEPLLFVDYSPPEGHVRYYVQARRIIGKHTVPSTTMWNEAEFFLTNFVIGGVCPPAAAQYNFSKGLMERFLKILTEIKLQESDLGEPETVYVPRPFERPSPPVSLAADPVKQVYASVPADQQRLQAQRREPGVRLQRRVQRPLSGRTGHRLFGVLLFGQQRQRGPVRRADLPLEAVDV